MYIQYAYIDLYHIYVKPVPSALGHLVPYLLIMSSTLLRFLRKKFESFKFIVAFRQKRPYYEASLWYVY